MLDPNFDKYIGDIFANTEGNVTEIEPESPKAELRTVGENSKTILEYVRPSHKYETTTSLFNGRNIELTVVDNDNEESNRDD